MRPITFAHRGAPGDLAENSLAAFERALARGASGLESDAWLSSDGEVVLVHDDVVRRGLRRHHVDRTSAANLAGLGVPSLADLYRRLGSDYELSLDLKGPGVGDHVVAVAEALGAPAKLWCCAGSVGTLQDLRGRWPAARLVHSTKRRSIRESLERYAANLAGDGIDAVNLHHREWTAGIVELVHRFELRAFAWDVQEVRDLRSMLTMGLDAVYSDHLDRMVATIGEWEDSPP